MSDQFIGEIRQVGFSFAPADWSICNGAILDIANNQALFSLLGAYFGGDARTTFGLPDLRGRVPTHPNMTTSGTVYQQGQMGGWEQMIMTIADMPAHNHELYASTSEADSMYPVRPGSQSNQFAECATGDVFYAPAANTQALSPDTITNTGGGQGFNIIQPTIAMLFIIALEGLYPSRN
ncbi:phage tail protein [Shewanella cyperi]|uniref:Phage tail protein n=1 Tax=Shewanella cyperi TaxID=2814292 RepID=A0A975ALB2_9GAMM|nr:tail fiber protein [Shewanella cyperi]QSX30227.1 phage tail protein [Shewanella cyperi]